MDSRKADVPAESDSLSRNTVYFECISSSLRDRRGEITQRDGRNRPDVPSGHDYTGLA